MPRKPRPLSNHALWACEDATACLIEIDAKSRQALDLVRLGDTLGAVLLLGDIRSKATDARLALARARAGEGQP